PGEFLDVAQESRLITGVSAVVLREACQQAAHWHREGWPVGVSVNVSASEIGSSLFMTTLKRALADTGLPPPSLCLEVTESVLFQASDAGQNHIQELKEIGVKLALDDFGTAFASLDYVRRFPIDRIKIDHSFIAGITNNPRDQAIAAGIIALADAIPVEVVAEGIETAEHLDRIRTTGCRLAQGFYLGTPQPAELIGSLLGKPEGSASPSA
ncbi:MAG TPA: EAL domain-containing protein, partial [Candidatus Dormibacteraeota bacterium]|nr:EAL domain-containing protein [Candidatus Dormibacteraeota bacterium]